MPLHLIWQKVMIWTEAVERAKEYISGALAAMLDLGIRQRTDGSWICDKKRIYVSKLSDENKRFLPPNILYDK